MAEELDQAKRRTIKYYGGSQEVEYTKYEIRNTGSLNIKAEAKKMNIRNTKYEIRNTKYPRNNQALVPPQSSDEVISSSSLLKTITITRKVKRKNTKY